VGDDGAHIAEVGSDAAQPGGVDDREGLLAPTLDDEGHDRPALPVLLPHGQRAKPTLTVRYKGPLRAPIAKGQDIAMLIVRAPGQPDARLPLVAGEAVPAGGALDRLRNGFAAMVGS
jgi:D-alanyl-D-alanine carboxypeptidase (penicillin-binding protein 5/6)